MAYILRGKIFGTWRLTIGTWGPAIPGPGKKSLSVFFTQVAYVIWGPSVSLGSCESFTLGIRLHRDKSPNLKKGPLTPIVVKERLRDLQG